MMRVLCLFTQFAVLAIGLDWMADPGNQLGVAEVKRYTAAVDQVLGIAVVPVHQKRNADTGRSLFWENRYFITNVTGDIVDSLRNETNDLCC